MNKITDYSKYRIYFTEEFDKAWSKLKSKRDSESKAMVNKTYQIIDDLLSGVDMEETYGAHHPGDTDVWDVHITPKGRTTGDLILLYKINSQSIEIDLRLQNITNHANLYKLSNPNYVHRQKLYDFDIITDKFSPKQLQFAEECYSNLLKDYRIFRSNGDEKRTLVDTFLHEYFETNSTESGLTFDQFMQLIHYIENRRKKNIFSSIDIDSPTKETYPVTEAEIDYILGLFDSFDINVAEAYVERKTDEYGDTYEDFYVSIILDDETILAELHSELDYLNIIFDIEYEFVANGLGEYGRTYDFYHYFM